MQSALNIICNKRQAYVMIIYVHYDHIHALQSRTRVAITCVSRVCLLSSKLSENVTDFQETSYGYCPIFFVFLFHYHQ
jgi:hypothetical protein